MTYSFNLVEQKWIPCVHFDGRVEEFSLREVLTQAHTLSGIQGDSPLETAALYRLLLAILHSALRGPRNRSEWSGLWAKSYWEPDLVNDYLDKWHDCFDLFHPEKPFYQVKDERAKVKSVITLVIDMASGNNGSLFDHHTEDVGVSLTPAKAAKTLVVAHNFSLAGLWMPGVTFTDAPWGRGIIFFVESDDLFKTLALNLLSYPDESRNNMASSRYDKPAWEREDPHLPIRQIPEGYLDYLTWQNRRVLFIPEGDEKAPEVRSMTMAPGLRLDGSILDPMKLYRTGNEEGYFSTRFTEDRSIWRDSASLFGLKSTRGNFPPKSFYWLADLAGEDAIPLQQKYRFMALGMANDQAKVEFFQQEHMPLPLEYLEQEELVESLASALELAEKTRFALKIASQWLALLVVSPKSDGKKWREVDRISKDQSEKLMTHWNVERFYWQQLGIPFQRFLEDLPEHPEALATWKEIIRRAAWDALEQAANFAGTDALALKADVRARGSLGYSLKELFPEPEKEVTA
jgi:CRISPR system Cascade subunit CasA